MIFTFSIGDPQMIHIGVDQSHGIKAVLVPGDPQPVPDWLRDELLQHSPQ